MTDLGTMSNVAQILGALTVIGGVVFAIAQLIEYRRQRQETAASELMRLFHNPELARAVRLIRDLPDDVSAEELRGRGTDYELAAIVACTTYETIGLLVFLDVTPFQLVRQLTGGIAVVMWRKLRRWNSEVRNEQSQPSWAEWFQWLAELMQRHADEKETEPAYKKYAAWAPHA